MLLLLVLMPGDFNQVSHLTSEQVRAIRDLISHHRVGQISQEVD